MFNLKPDYFIKGNIASLDLDLLQEDNIQGLILDLDNTIMRPKSGFFCEVVRPWLQKAKCQGLKLIIVTNNKNEKYLSGLSPILNDLELPIIIKAAKPKPAKLLEALRQIDLPAEKVCIIGDRLLTDVLGGYNIGAKTAFVYPLLGKQENLLFRFLRKLEYLFLHFSYWKMAFS